MGPAQKEAPPVGALGQVPRGGARGPAHGYGHGHVRRKGEALLVVGIAAEQLVGPFARQHHLH